MHSLFEYNIRAHINYNYHVVNCIDYTNDKLLRLSDYHDSTCHRDSLGLFTVVIVDCLTI